jgi:hypothetical protein
MPPSRNPLPDKAPTRIAYFRSGPKEHSSCGQRIFKERLAVTAARPFARRTTPLEGIVHHLGLALGGRPGQGFARRLLLPVSKDTLLRVVRRHAALPVGVPRVVGIDDWAFKRGHRYGTIICDLERRRIIDLLPGREAATVAAWLTARPLIVVIARDHGAGNIQAASDGRPEAIQVQAVTGVGRRAGVTIVDGRPHSMPMRIVTCHCLRVDCGAWFIPALAR